VVGRPTAGDECTYMPASINGRPWPQVFLKDLAKGLRKMESEFPKQGAPSQAEHR
jgi:hypothetical protein